MNNIYTILKKELRAYFYHPTAYILLVVFLAISYFFYFRPVLIIGEASMRPLFDTIPWILMFFVPALTMGLMAKEKSDGTFEILSTQPIGLWQIMLGKIFGALVFIMLAMLLTLSIPLTLSRFGSFDIGMIVAQYVGTLFLSAAFTVIGMWASSITKNQIISFVLAITINFALIFAGFEMITLSLVYPFDLIFKNLSILDHFYNVARGVIDVRDVIYFVCLILIFGFLTYLAMLKTKGGPQGKNFKKLSTVVMLMAVVALIANLAGGYVKARIDLTRGQIYTLSQATKKILNNLDKEIDIHFVVSKQVPAQLQNSVRDVNDMLDDYVRASKGKINLYVYHPDKVADAVSRASEFGIPPVQFNVIAEDEFSTKKGYFGLAMTSGIGAEKKQETIPLIERTDNLEYQLTGFIWKMINQHRKKIAWLAGDGEKGINNELSYLGQELNNQYEVNEITLASADGGKTETNIPQDTDVLIIAGPSTKLDESVIKKINEYLSDGGSAFIMAETVNVNTQFMMATSSAGNINALLNEWGVNIDENLVYDLAAHENVTFGDGRINYILPYPLWVTAGVSEGNIVSADIKSIMLPWGSTISAINNQPDSGSAIIPLYVTTDYGGVISQDFNLDPNQAWPRSNLSKKILALAIEKKFADKITRLAVLGNVNFTLPNFVQNAPNNAIFLLNTIEWLAEDDILSSIRIKNIGSAALIFGSDKAKNNVKYFNLVGLPMLVIAAGVIIIARRKKRMKKFF